MDFMSALMTGTNPDPVLQVEHLNAPRSKTRQSAPSLTDLDLEALFDLGDDDIPTLPSDLSDYQIAELRILCNRMFKEMNKDFPRFGAREDYEVLREELDARSGKQLG